MSENLMINRSLIKEITIPADTKKVWTAWTTKDGLETFFAPEVNIELKIFGDYEILFFPENKPGKRGAEGNKITAIEPYHMFSFTWDAPPHLANVRQQRTLVVLKFEKTNSEKTRVVLCQTGWGDGQEWQAAYDYFSQAWQVVLERLKLRFEKGPIDWKNNNYPRFGR